MWVAGGVISDDFKVAMALTAGWFAVAAAAALVLAIRVRPLQVPVIGGYLVGGALIGGFLAWSTLHDRVAHERVVAGVPLSQVSSARGARRANVELVAGRFVSLEHASRGTAAVVRLPSGRRKLTLTDFSTSPGPDLRVRLVVGTSTDGASAGARDLGGLKGNRGSQQYDLPADIDLGRYRSVVVWCRAFSAAFAQARLSVS